MKKILPYNFTFIFVLFIILIVAVFSQTQTYANHDSVWLLYCTNLYLHGGKYFYDFFETNPPLIFYFQVPVVLLANFSHLSAYWLLQAYIFTWIILVLIISYFLLKKIFIQQTFFIKPLVILLAIYLSILPFMWLADREAYTNFLITPYLFLMTLRLQDKKVPFYLACILGIFASIGFAMKPYFLAPLILIELYYLYHCRRFFAWIKPESIIILVIMVVYLVSTFFIAPEYFTKIYPLTNALYIPTFGKKTTFDLWFTEFSLYGMLSCLLIGWQIYFVKGEEKPLLIILLLSCIGFLITYLLGQRIWLYHALPLIVFSSLGLSISVIAIFKKLSALKIYRAFPWLQSCCGFLSLLIILHQLFNTAFWNSFSFFMKSNPKSPETSLLTYIQQHAQNQNVLIFSYWFVQETIRYYTNSHITSRFPSMLLVPGITKLQLEGKQQEYSAMKNAFFDILMQDIQRKPPKYIAIEKMGYWLYYKNKGYTYQFIPFLNSDTRFKQFFQHYHLIANTTYFLIYQSAE